MNIFCSLSVLLIIYLFYSDAYSSSSPISTREISFDSYSTSYWIYWLTNSLYRSSPSSIYFFIEKRSLFLPCMIPISIWSFFDSSFTKSDLAFNCDSMAYLVYSLMPWTSSLYSLLTPFNSFSTLNTLFQSISTVWIQF